MAKLTPKEKIFNAAVDCLSTCSYSQCTMEMIGRQIGVTAASIYNHYQSKKLLLHDIFAYFLAHFNQYRTPPEQILAAARTRPMREVFPLFFYTFGTEQEMQLMMKLCKIVINLKHESKEANDAYRTCLYEDPKRYMRETLSALMAEGLIPPVDIPTLAYLMQSLATTTLQSVLADEANRPYYTDLFAKGIEMLARLVEK